MSSLPQQPWYLYFDGACSPRNPGGDATYGWVIYTSAGDVVSWGNGYLGSGEGATCNVAEYAALEEGLLWLEENAHHVSLKIYGDSMLVVKQISRKWRIKKKHLRDRADRIWACLLRIGKHWEIHWIPREINTEADAICGEVFIPEVKTRVR